MNFAKGLVGPTSTVVFFAVGSGIVDACLAVGRELRIGRVEAKHVHAACAALDAFPGAMLVASTAVRHAERDLIEKHAARAQATVVWVGLDDDVVHIVSTIRSWASASCRLRSVGRPVQ